MSAYDEWVTLARGDKFPITGDHMFKFFERNFKWWRASYPPQPTRQQKLVIEYWSVAYLRHVEDYLDHHVPCYIRYELKRVSWWHALKNKRGWDVTSKE